MPNVPTRLKLLLRPTNIYNTKIMAKNQEYNDLTYMYTSRLDDIAATARNLDTRLLVRQNPIVSDIAQKIKYSVLGRTVSPKTIVQIAMTPKNPIFISPC